MIYDYGPSDGCILERLFEPLLPNLRRAMVVDPMFVIYV
jgi:hypothetical protein